MKHADETQGVVQAFNEKIARITQVRDLLNDRGVLALVKEIIQPPAPSVRAGKHSADAGTRPYGGIVRAVFEIVTDMGDKQFTKRDLAERLRRNGYEIKKPSSSALFYATRQLVADKVIEQIGQGGGNRPDVYQRIKARRTEISIEHTEGNHIGTSASAIPRPLRLRNGMEQIAWDCIARLPQPFATHELINDMRAAGFTFAGNADLSIQPVLRRLLNRGILEIVQEGAGQQPTIYKRRDGMQENVAQRF